MTDQEKTKKRLINELEQQRKRIEDLEALVLTRTACLTAALKRLIAQEQGTCKSEMQLD